MKSLFVFLVYFAVFSVVAQEEEIFSVYFTNDKVDGYDEVENVDSRYFKSYGLVKDDQNVLRSTAGDVINVDKSGIYIERNQVVAISKEEVRENSQYLVRGNYIHGVIEGDSLPVALQDQKYFFLVPTKAYLFEVKNAGNMLYKLDRSGEFLVMTKEDNGYYSGLYIKFVGKSFQLLELSLECDSFDLRKTKDKEVREGDFPTYIIDPDAGEWKDVLGCFVAYDNYTEVVE